MLALDPADVATIHNALKLAIARYTDLFKYVAERGEHDQASRYVEARMAYLDAHRNLIESLPDDDRKKVGLE